MTALTRSPGRDEPLRTPSTARTLPLFLKGVALFILFAAVLGALISATPGFVGNDDYYHARVGAEIAEQGRLAIAFPWLPQTILSPDKFVDHHLLYHLYIAPWMHFGGAGGAKVAQVLIVAGLFVACWALLCQIGVRVSALWACALFGLSTPFLYRLLMIRTQGASALLLVLALMALFGRRHLWLVGLSFAYAWLYNGFVLMPAFAALYVAATWLSDRRLDLRPIAYSLLGIALGIVVNPYFPRNVAFAIEHLGAKVDFESGVRVGSEWYPYTTGALLETSAGALLALVLGVLRPSVGGGRRDRIETTLLFVALLMLFMLFRSRRFVEYYPLFALLFCAAAWGRNHRQFLLGFSRRLIVMASALVVLSGSVFIAVTLDGTRRMIEGAPSPSRFEGAAHWLQTNTPEGAPVFQLDWDDFTSLLYHNTHNTYLVGLDPTYLERADPALWDVWVSITRGEVERPSAIIRERFGAAYAVGDRDHDEFAARAADDPDMTLVYWDASGMVWRITD